MAGFILATIICAFMCVAAHQVQFDIPPLIGDINQALDSKCIIRYNQTLVNVTNLEWLVYNKYGEPETVPNQTGKLETNDVDGTALTRLHIEKVCSVQYW